jgi:N-acetylmuramoyl-L-alanine amidase
LNWRNLIGLMLLWLSCASHAEQQITDMRIWSAPEHTKVVLELSAPVEYSVDYVRELDQLTIALADTDTLIFLDRLMNNDPRVQVIRTKIRPGQFLITLDLKGDVRVSSFLAKPKDQYNYRLIIDVADNTLARYQPKKKHDLLVVIDPGHGGEDPGAIGASGTHEKRIVLGIAEKLQRQLRRHKNITVVMTREGDYALSLRERVRVANKRRADVFVSIHANKFRDSKVSGASVFVQSRFGASSSLAKALAQSENDVDSLGGVDTESSNPDLDFVLRDLTSSANKNLSTKLAKIALKEMDRVAHVHSKDIQHANFFVLREAQMPAILIEAGFISNHDEEEQMLSGRYQNKIAKALSTAILQYRRSVR